jgi:hypothetical protein
LWVKLLFSMCTVLSADWLLQSPFGTGIHETRRVSEGLLLSAVFGRTAIWRQLNNKGWCMRKNQSGFVKLWQFMMHVWYIEHVNW